MPIYDYVCASCSTLTEVIHGIDAAGPRFCPACGAEGTMRKTIVTPAVHFKGSGWAKKDRASSSRTRAGSDSKGGDHGTTGGGSGDSKDAAGAAKSDGGADKNAGKASDSKSSSTSTAAAGEG